MSIDKLSRVSTLGAGDLVAISSAGLGADAVVALQTLTDHVLDQVDVANGIPNDGSVTPEKLSIDVLDDIASRTTAVQVDAKIQAAIDAIDIPAPGSDTPQVITASTVIPLNGNFVMPDVAYPSGTVFTRGTLAFDGVCAFGITAVGGATYDLSALGPLSGDAISSTAGDLNRLVAYNGYGNRTEVSNRVFAAPVTAPSLSISGTPVTTATAGTAYTGFSVTAANGAAPRSFSVVGGPSGMVVTKNSETAATVTYPTPAQGSYSNIKIRVTDSTGATADLTFSLTVQAATVTPTQPGAPGTPVATAGVGSISFAFAPPASNGGAAIDSYRLTTSLGEVFDGPSSPIVATGLSTVARTGQVQAHNSVSYGPSSAASNSVTPTAAAAPITSNFTQADGPLGAPYESHNGATFKTEGNQALVDTQKTAGFIGGVRRQCNSANGVFEIDFILNQYLSGVGHLLRVVDDNNYLCYKVFPDYVQVVSVTAGDAVSVKSVNGTYPHSTLTHAKATLAGSNITIVIPGGPDIVLAAADFTGSSAHTSGTKFGMTDQIGLHDNFSFVPA
jgi:hypothetical protein